MNIKSLFSIAAASLGLGIAVIVDQPAAFARCDHGNCQCRTEKWSGDKVNHDKCRDDQFCAQKVPEHGSKHVYQCRPRKPKGWGCTEDRQCKCNKCRNGKCYERAKDDYDYWCRRDGKSCGVECRNTISDCRKECRRRTGDGTVCYKIPTRRMTNGKYTSVACD